MRLSRSTILVATAAVVLAGGAAVYLITQDNSSEDGVETTADLAPEEGENAAETFADGKDELLQVSGSLLQLHDLDNGDETDIDTLPSNEVAAAPGSPWIAYVERTASDKADLHLYDTSGSEEEKNLGPGVDPFWNSTGTRVAYFRTDDPACQDESCTGELMVADPEGGEPTQVLEAGPWRIVGWAGDYILVLDDDDPARTLVASPTGDTGRLDFSASVIKGASPDGSWLVKSGGKKTTLVPMENGAVAGDEIKVDLGNEFLTAAFFSPDSTQVAAIAQPAVEDAIDLDALRESLKEKVKQGKISRDKARDQFRKAAAGSIVASHIVMFTPDEPEVERFDPSERPRQILWSPENDAFVYSALVDPEGELFQSFYCGNVQKSSDCDLLTSWSRGVELLRVQ